MSLVKSSLRLQRSNTKKWRRLPNGLLNRKFLRKTSSCARVGTIMTTKSRHSARLRKALFGRLKNLTPRRTVSNWLRRLRLTQPELLSLLKRRRPAASLSGA